MRSEMLMVCALFSLGIGCSDEPPKGIDALNGAWEVSITGSADPVLSDDQLSAYEKTKLVSVITLSGGKGTEKTSNAFGTMTCAYEREVTIILNDDKTGTFSKGEEAKLVEGEPAKCTAGKDYGLFAAGNTKLQRISNSGSRLVLMKAGQQSVPFAVLSKR